MSCPPDTSRLRRVTCRLQRGDGHARPRSCEFPPPSNGAFPLSEARGDSSAFISERTWAVAQRDHNCCGQVALVGQAYRQVGDSRRLSQGGRMARKCHCAPPVGMALNLHRSPVGLVTDRSQDFDSRFLCSEASGQARGAQSRRTRRRVDLVFGVDALQVAVAESGNALCYLVDRQYVRSDADSRSPAHTARSPTQKPRSINTAFILTALAPSTAVKDRRTMASIIVRQQFIDRRFSSLERVSVRAMAAHQVARLRWRSLVCLPPVLKWPNGTGASGNFGPRSTGGIDVGMPFERSGRPARGG